MIRSMTGFGKASVKFKDGGVTAEIKTVNHKFFDATLKIPEQISAFEDKLKELLQKRIKRGKVYLNLTFDGTVSRKEMISINKKMAKGYYDELTKLKKHLGLKDDIATKDVIALPGVLDYKIMEGDFLNLWPRIKEAIEKAVTRLVSDREKEGSSIYKEIEKRVKKIEGMLAAIKSRAHLNIEEYRRRFAERVKDIASGRQIDMGRLEMEVAIFAKNSDISEELSRLKNHISNLKRTISGNGDVGKKLDFIAQELHREINTVGSKASDFKISKNVIEIKGEIEKIREQAKNIE